MASFQERYGPWAVVAGASEGIGASFSRRLAGRGLNLVLLARRAGRLEELASELRTKHGVEVKTQSLDLGATNLLEGLKKATADLDVGLAIYNAAYSPIGRFLDVRLEDHFDVINVNVRGPLVVSHYFGQRLAARGRGGLILMSSMSGYQGTAMVANYAATKAYDTILAEGLWYELQEQGIDVLACVAGATLTPSFEQSTDRTPSSWLARPMQPDEVTGQALRDLGQQPTGVSGRRNRFGATLLGRILPRRAAIRMVSKETEHMYR
ncbi:MAG: SDR family NAD(P)-dependent oxidoreductase [Myxococcales bacterium]|nr:SDR family NAD(P)-dependent oxidoreductase [Myxococcales bacterium]MDH3482681.1 SDR family NAD(P)-dependent oxidoreductase [Myxococcales bacterium]